MPNALPSTFADFKNEISSLGITTTVTWVVGGMWGGNCWGGEADVPRSADPEPELSPDLILEYYAPDIALLDYKKLMRLSIIEEETHSDNEYYGNYTEYKTKTLKLEIIYEFLNDYLKV